MLGVNLRSLVDPDTVSQLGVVSCRGKLGSTRFKCPRISEKQCSLKSFLSV